MPSVDVKGLADVREEVRRVEEAGQGNIRVHPNGFIQLDLQPVPESWHASHQRGHSGAARRLHIWNPPGIELPHQETVNEIHDHVFDMRSTVLMGTLWQLRYEFTTEKPDTPDPDLTDHPTHELYRAVYEKNSDSRLQPTGQHGWTELESRIDVRAGESYTQPAFTLHDTVADGCVVTVMTKEKIHEGDAHVVCLIDQPPDNSFDRASAAPAELLWDAVWRSIVYDS